MKPLFIHYPKCGTCRKAYKWLEENGIEVESRHIVENNPNKEELSEWIDKSGLPISRFFNTSGIIYRENNLKEKVNSASRNELLEILASNGMVVKRPIVVGDDFVLVGFNEKQWSEKLL
ncbi:MAG TPA: arsenate reductase family protein [Fermentimonas caenicola]|jgi:arsenate reductase|uniref:ArsC family protein n=1 Tax=Fermentimonas caenicola TaxID=1562970 RepID=A0A098C2A8_9BACT|nr:MULTISPECIES: arsenate reductase family protein [Lascolabacillus]MBP6175429.1 arsenate reductase family protein [Fermentimonas sp.]MDI9625306.1 arsenate reductase family protein [Bacteroidota bacterium]TAH60679.1 MAG: arsenate reductase family protein [Fermentimonas caenicola]MBP6196455.1 arsenate reductase family protein [Fermentimonas sp.]MBP7104743.1 arsenate reductase family protein [Fermentimonas sp.]